jgi:hypothetical protein
VAATCRAGYLPKIVGSFAAAGALRSMPYKALWPLTRRAVIAYKMAMDHSMPVLQRCDGKNLRMDFCTQNRFNFVFR